MKQPLHAKVPSFIGDTNINLSWKEATKPLPSAATTTIGFVSKLTQSVIFFYRLVSVCSLC